MSWLSKATGVDIKVGGGGSHARITDPFAAARTAIAGTGPLSTPNAIANASSSEAADGSVSNLSVGQIRSFMGEGRAKGEELTGTNAKEIGEGRADVRDRLKETLAGNSAGANALRQDQAQAQKSLRAQQAVAGQGQMNAGQQQALQRQASRDLAGFVSNERRQALSDLSKEYRGAGGDIMRSEGQYGSILVGSQPAAQPQQASGVFTQLFGGLF